MKSIPNSQSHSSNNFPMQQSAKVKTTQNLLLNTAKPTSAQVGLKKERTKVIIEPKRQASATQSQPLFLRQSNVSLKTGKENSAKVAAQNDAYCRQTTIAQPSKVATKGLHELINQKRTSPKTSKPLSIPVGLPRPNTGAKSPPLKSGKSPPTQKYADDTKTLQTMPDDASECTEPAQFVSKKNPHKIVREIQKNDRLFMFATYDHLADPAVFRKVLQELPTQRTFPQEMCQLIIKDFELCFGKVRHERDAHTPSPNKYDEYYNPEDSTVPEEAPDVKPFAKKSKNKVLFVQAYLLPLAQLLELITHITGASRHELKIPERFSFKQPLKLITPRSSFYNSLTKLSPFEQLDVLCLTRDITIPGSACREDVIPPKALVRTLFQTYSNVFKINQTEHTLLYYLYQLPQIISNYQMTDILHVVALDLIRQAQCLKQEEPTIVDPHHCDIAQPLQADYERTDSPPPQVTKASVPFRISLVELPHDPGSAEKADNNSEDYEKNRSVFHQINGKNRRSAANLNNSYLMSNQKSQASLNLDNKCREQLQEVLSMASEKKFGLGGNIISGLSKPGLGGAFGSFSRNSLTQSGMNTIQSDLTAFGNCPFNASNLSLSVYGNNSILGGAANNPYNRGAYAMMNGLHNMSPNRPPLLENYPSPYGRPSMDTQQTRRQTSKF